MASSVRIGHRRRHGGECPINEKEDCRYMKKSEETRRRMSEAAKRRALPLTERFWSKVEKNSPIPTHRPELGPCWVWTASRDRYGYGRLSENGKTIGAHRISWEIAVGAIPDGLWVLHQCDNPSCVRPDHLFLGTPRENSKDRVSKGRHVNAGAMFHPRRGMANHNARLTEQDVREIRSRYASEQVGIRPLAKQYGVHRTVVRDILRRRIWSHVE
jgi:hypothetical protein